MKSKKQLMTELSHRVDYFRMLTAEESSLLKQTLLSIYKDIAEVCGRNGLTLMLIGGSCLGAVRHKGFIPWDDDLDLLMPRRDYNKLIALMEGGALGDKYEYTYAGSKIDSRVPFVKVYLKNTLDIEIGIENSPQPKGVFVDIFPLENIPANSIIRRIRGFFTNAFRYISNVTFEIEYHSDLYEEYCNLDPDTLRDYKRRQLIGRIFRCVAKHRTWQKWYDRLSSYDKETSLMGIPMGRGLYSGEILERRYFLPASFGTFEGICVCLPHDPDAYLKNLYRNYMEIPPEEKRERHFVYKFSLDNTK